MQNYLKNRQRLIYSEQESRVCSFFLSPLLDFIGLHYVSAIVERMLVMSYPIFVMIISFFGKMEKITAADIVSVVVVSIGIFFPLAAGTCTN